ncbi:TnsA-like heteromeric transposase endonuclease subunit [Nonomuraea muscovyensis]|uniref:TnsA-like heteromeric transposase endonuclease subunit n=1 Tax=Nonomuraea muscovyensis TaxID=1124761 RepID=A0A7X0C454_9ACTN|nr:TnsA-like heteromeric transposase endonuclease subunit [Nonomuraea muscovyensis]MBB6347326.1 hypothetical protein [Nonomuraea muscovyensis]
MTEVHSVLSDGQGFEVAFLDEDGVDVTARYARRGIRVLSVLRLSGPSPPIGGQKNFPGLWWFATTGQHVGYESWTERDVVMMLDFDPRVVVASQPFWLIWRAGTGRLRRHVPDYFARTVDGQGVVVDVRPDDRVDAPAAEAFATMAQACREVGWEFRRTACPVPTLRANVRWLAGYRHRRCFAEDIAGVLMEAFTEPAPLLATAQRVGDQLAVVPVLYHLLWRGLLLTDLASAPLAACSIVWASEEEG